MAKKIEIDKKEFESLLAIQCSCSEIVAFYQYKLGSMCDETIRRFCVREYGKSFKEVAEEKRAVGKIGLRRAGFELAKKNAAVHIFYCKNYLGMTDKVVTESTVAVSDNFLEALNSTASEDWKEEESESKDADE